MIMGATGKSGESMVILAGGGVMSWSCRRTNRERVPRFPATTPGFPPD